MTTLLGGRNYGDVTLYRRLLSEAGPYRWHIVVLLVLSLLAAPLNLLFPVPIKVVVDNVLGDQPLPPWLGVLVPQSLVESANGLLFFAMAMFVFIALLQQLRALAYSVLQVYTGEHLTLRFRSKLFHHLERMSLAFHDRQGVADPVYRIQYDAVAVEGFITNGVIPLVGALVTILAMVFVILRIDWVLTLVALAIAPLILFLAQSFRGRLRSQWSHAKQRESAVMGVGQEVLAGLRVVKAFGQETREEQRFVQRGVDSIGAKVRAMTTQSLFNLIIGLLVALGTAAVLFMGAQHVEAGIITLGDLVQITVYLAMLYPPIEAIGMKIASLQSALASADRAYTILEEPFDVPEQPDARPISHSRGAVTFRSVSFAYDSDHRVMNDITFDVSAGSRVGIAGETGAGKTTLINLLPRFYDPTAGQILLDGVDLREYKLADLRHQFAIVLQEPVLFSTTIAENIAYGLPDAGMDEIAEAAKAANAHDFIVRLPDGYNAQVGERGMRLSGGERQRIALARAFLRDAPILILDEPTSSIDVGTEALVMDAMERLMKGRTTFIIAHRLNTLESCDQFLVLERGRLVHVKELHEDLVQAVMADLPDA